MEKSNGMMSTENRDIFQQLFRIWKQEEVDGVI